MTQARKVGSPPAKQKAAIPDRAKMAAAAVLVLGAVALLIFVGKVEGFWLQPNLDQLADRVAQKARHVRPDPEALAVWQRQHPGEKVIPFGVPLKPGQTRPSMHGPPHTD